MSNALPDLPKPFFWTNDSNFVAILKARDTQWCKDRNVHSEALGLIEILANRKYKLQVWKRPSTGGGNWADVQAQCATLQEAANMLWALCQLGEIDFSFLEKRDE